MAGAYERWCESESLDPRDENAFLAYRKRMRERKLSFSYGKQCSWAIAKAYGFRLPRHKARARFSREELDALHRAARRYSRVDDLFHILRILLETDRGVGDVLKLTRGSLRTTKEPALRYLLCVTADRNEQEKLFAKSYSTYLERFKNVQIRMFPDKTVRPFGSLIRSKR